jgi:dephospho-CoA kinase
MKVVGLTGGIASGKSTVSNMISKMGIPVIDGDKIARDVIDNNGILLEKLVNTFGNKILNDDGTLNRKQLGSIVFGSATMLNKLNTIMHPEIKAVILDKISYYRNIGCECCVIDAALLTEGIFINFFAILIIVYVNRDIQLRRLIERENINIDEAIKKINSQISFEEKKKFADYIIDNNYDLEYTEAQLNRIFKEILLSEG